MKKPVKNTKPVTSQDTALRRRAEKMAHKKAALSLKKPGAMSPEEMRRTLHELQVHQIELEMQNEEMRRTQVELDAARVRYFDLYDLAPVGYCTISKQGLIMEANLTASTLLGVPRGKLVKQLLARFILKKDQDIYYLHRKKLLDTGEPQTCELQIVKKDGTIFWAHLTEAAAKDESGATVCRVVMSDITERKRMEEKLRFEEQRFRTFVEHSSDIIVLLNLEGIITYINPAVERVLGFKPEERIGAKGFELVHPDNRKFLADSFNTLSRDTNSPVIQGELHLRHKDESWRTFEAVGSNLVNKNVVEAIIVNYRDITDRKQAEEELHRSEEKYRTILENIQEAYFEVDLAGNFTFFNDSVCRILGYPRKELMGMNYRQYINKEELEKILKTYNKVYKTEKPLKENGYWISRKDGFRRYIEGSVSLLKNSSGKPSGFRGIMNDFTERKVAESQREAALEALRESENRLRAQYNGNPIPTFTWQKQGDEFILQDFNDSAKTLTSGQTKTFLGRQASEMYKGRQEILVNLQRCFDEKIIIRIESKSEHFMPGKSVVITFVFVPPDLVMVYMEDITERKQTEEYLKKYREHLEELVREHTIKLEATNKELEAFSYSASHDLRAPLRSIDGFSQALMEDCEDKLDIQGKDYLMRIRAATRRMADLIEDLLQLSRLTRTEMNIEKINLTRIVLSVIDELQKSQPQRHVEIKIADGLEDIADSRLMRITLDNLLGNAWKFTQKQTKAIIEFGCTEEGGRKVYFIRDNGAGFDMAYVDKLFAPFQRLHTEEEFPGTGIGLALVRRIIHRHGGKVWTEGQTGKGATFYFSLHEY
jgi:PAS domain S-box-containing protein